MTGMFTIDCTCGMHFTAVTAHVKHACPQCGCIWYKNSAGQHVGMDDDGQLIRVSPTPSLTTRERLGILWENEKDRLSPELREFLRLAVVQMMEAWRGGEPPKPQMLTVTVIEPDKHECGFQSHIKHGAKCIHCGKKLEDVWHSQWEQKDFGTKFSPYSGFGNNSTW